MKTKIVAAAIALLMLLAAVPMVSAVQNEENKQLQEVNIEKLSNELNKIQSLNIPYKAFTSSATAGIAAESAMYPFPVSYTRNGIICGDNIAEYKIRMKMSTGEYDYTTLTSIVKEDRPWHTNSKRVHIMLPGEFLTAVDYMEQACFYAENFDLNVVIFDRREGNFNADTPIEKVNAAMASWSLDAYLNDMYWSTAVSRLHHFVISDVSFKEIEKIEINGEGHSLGAFLLFKYDERDYEKKYLGRLNKIALDDMAIRFDPLYSDLIQNQKNNYDKIKNKITEDKNFVNSGGRDILGITYLAYDPATRDQNSTIEGLEQYTNDQVFNLMNCCTFMFDEFPFTPAYHYLDGDISGLVNVDEEKVKETVLGGGVNPYSPWILDLEIAGLEGNIEGYQFDVNKIDTEVLYNAFDGGFDFYGEYFIREIAKAKKEKGIQGGVEIRWHNCGGHACINFNDLTAPEIWRSTGQWLTTN